MLHQRLDVVPLVGFEGPRFAVVRQRVLIEDAAVEVVAVLVEIVAGKFETELFGEHIVEPLPHVDVPPAADAESAVVGRHDDGRVVQVGAPHHKDRHARGRIHFGAHADHVAARADHWNHLRGHFFEFPGCVMAHLVFGADELVGIYAAV